MPNENRFIVIIALIGIISMILLIVKVNASEIIIEYPEKFIIEETSVNIKATPNNDVQMFINIIYRDIDSVLKDVTIRITYPGFDTPNTMVVFEHIPNIIKLEKSKDIKDFKILQEEEEYVQ